MIMRSKILFGIVAGFGLMGTGCQTYFAGQTLPSPRYLDHYPQYFQREPDFPLQKELNSMMDDGTGAVRGPAQAAPAGNLGGIPANTAPTQR
jgi:hypothetical protein